MSESEKEHHSLLIIKSSAHTLVPVENFLKNRGWNLFSTTDLKQAISLMMQHQPSFVMISVDHPNKKITKLAKVITQAFPCCLIAFAEHATPSSYKTLSEASTEYLIYPPVTGPAVERTVNKFLKDQAAGGITNPLGEKNYSANYQAPDAVVNIKGKGVTLQSLMAQVLGEEVAGNGYLPDGQTHLGSVNVLEQETRTHGSATNEGDGPGRTLSSATADPRNLERSSAIGSGATRGEGNFARSSTSYTPFDTELERKRHGITDSLIFPTRNYRDSIILKGSREALEKTSVKDQAAVAVEPLPDKWEVFCILIHSPKFAGYLLTAMDPKVQMKENFINLVRERLFKFLTANGENVADQRNMSLQLQQVPFEAWAIEQAEFLCKAHHNKNEVAMAFFPHKEALTKVSASANSEMFAVETALLEPDAPVKCNIYLYLPANQKYILYTPQGGKVYSKQIEKLMREGVSHVHILKEEVHDFHAYRAQNYLNQKIGEFTEDTKAAVKSTH